MEYYDPNVRLHDQTVELTFQMFQFAATHTIVMRSGSLGLNVIDAALEQVFESLPVFQWAGSDDEDRDESQSFMEYAAGESVTVTYIELKAPDGSTMMVDQFGDNHVEWLRDMLVSARIVSQKEIAYRVEQLASSIEKNLPQVEKNISDPAIAITASKYYSALDKLSKED